MAVEMNQELKFKLVRIVAKLTRMAMKYENAIALESAYALSSDYEHELHSLAFGRSFQVP
jgi:hypothetical protein